MPESLDPRRMKDIFQYPLVELSEGNLSLASIVTGVVVIILFALFASIVGKTIRRMLEPSGMTEGARFAIAKIVRYIIVTIGVLVAVNSMGLNLGAVLAASTVLLVGIGLGLQQISQNFISGLIILVEQPIRKGDFIQVGTTFGIIEDIGLRATHVITRDSVTIIVPNSEMISSRVINHSVPHPQIRVAVNVGVAYGSDIDKVRDILLEVAHNNPRVLKSPRPLVRFDDFGDSSLNFTLLVWIQDPPKDLVIASDLRFTIDRAFRGNDIQIPFPQRDLHIRSGLEPISKP